MEAERIPEGLSPGERGVYYTLLNSVSARLKKKENAPRVVVIMDIGADYDDLLALIALKEGHRVGAIKLKGVITNLMPAKQRARQAKGALICLGLPEIPVGVGTKGSIKNHEEKDYEFKNCPFMAPEDTKFEDGEKLLKRILDNKGEKTTVLLLSSLQDIDKFTKKYPALVKESVSKFVLQGDYSIVDSIDNGNLKQTLTPNLEAANNRFHPDASKSFHEFIAKKKIPSVVYTRATASATRIPATLLDFLANSKHPIGTYLKETQVAMDLVFYARCLLPPAERFAPHMDAEWFLKLKTTWYDTHGPNDAKPVTAEDLLPFLRKVVAYDAIAALGTFFGDALKNLDILNPEVKAKGLETVHQKFGHSEEGPGCDINVKEMALAISALVKGAILAAQQSTPGWW